MLRDDQAMDLIERAKRGSRAAFDSLFSGAQERLAGFARSRLGPRLRQRVDPDDILQETLLRAYRSIGLFQWNGEESFHRWLEGIASHVILDAVRRLERRKELQIVRDPTGSGISPSRGLQRKERSARLKQSIERLSPDYRTVVVLSRIEGLTAREIGDRIGRSESAVRNLLFRAMKELKRTFGDTESFHLAPESFDGKGDDHGA